MRQQRYRENNLESVRPLVRRGATPERRRRKRERPELPSEELERLIQTLEEEMHQAAKNLRFEYAARLRDEVKDLRTELNAMRKAGVP